MTYCLIKPLAEEFKKLIKSGDIDINKLSNMTSEERRTFFNEKLGERNAKEVNALFESKLLLKNQRQGMVNWAKQITGITPEVKNTLIDRIMKMDKLLNPEEDRIFLNDLVSKRLGTDVTIEEARQITQLSNKLKSLENFSNESERIKYGRAKIDLADYVNSLNPKKANLLINIANIPRALMASFDLSAPLNQGWGMLSRKQFYTSLKTMLKVVKSDEAFNNLMADIITRPTYKSANKAGLRISNIGFKLEQHEEQFMTTLLDKVPGFKASERAYVGFLNKLRMDVYDDLLSKMQIAGEDTGIGSQATKDLANMINNFTGGARMGKIEGATPALNAMFFSPRKIKSSLEMMNPLNYLNPKISPIVRKEAVKNLIGSLSISAGILKLASLSGIGKIELDPRSSDFGKIVIGNTHLDLTGGNAGYATLLSRIITGETKSTNTGILSKLGNNYGQTSKFDLATSFGRNKLSPNASLLVDFFTGSNSIGEKKSVDQSLIDRMKPMFLNNLVEIAKDDKTNVFQKSLVGSLSLFGANLSVYSISENWNEKSSKEMLNFKNKIGQEKFNQANEEYNKVIDLQINNLIKTDKYKKMSDEEKLKEISKIKDTTKKEVLKHY